jgi:indolepyruvate decarboxylase
MGREDVRRYVESSDCVLLLGAFMTDINLGIYTARLDQARCIYATSERLSVQYRSYENIRFKDFVRGLVRTKWPRRRAPQIPRPVRPAAPTRRHASRAITVRSLFERINWCLSDDTVVVADVGDALFGAADLFIHRRTEFLAPAYYTSMGFGVPASIGAQLANPRLRPLVLVGDGAFQMTGMELGTAVRHGLSPIVIVLNNRGYGTERHILDGPFNDVATWRFHQLPQVFGAGRAWLVQTNGELDAALTEACRRTPEFCLIEVMLNPLDRSPALDRLAKRLADRLKGKARAW